MFNRTAKVHCQCHLNLISCFTTWLCDTILQYYPFCMRSTFRETEWGARADSAVWWCWRCHLAEGLLQLLYHVPTPLLPTQGVLPKHHPFANALEQLQVRRRILTNCMGTITAHQYYYHYTFDHMICFHKKRTSSRIYCKYWDCGVDGTGGTSWRATFNAAYLFVY